MRITRRQLRKLITEIAEEEAGSFRISSKSRGDYSSSEQRGEEGSRKGFKSYGDLADLESGSKLFLRQGSKRVKSKLGGEVEISYDYKKRPKQGDDNWYIESTLSIHGGESLGKTNKPRFTFGYLSAGKKHRQKGTQGYKLNNTRLNSGQINHEQVMNVIKKELEDQDVKFLLKSLKDFLGIEWNDRMREFQSTGKSHSKFRPPSGF